MAVVPGELVSEEREPEAELPAEARLVVRTAEQVVVTLQEPVEVSSASACQTVRPDTEQWRIPGCWMV